MPHLPRSADGPHDSPDHLVASFYNKTSLSHPEDEDAFEGGSSAPIKVAEQVPAMTREQVISLLAMGSLPLLIDMRGQPAYDGRRLQRSIHLNIPSLLLKRYKRGTMANFNLESFITTADATDHYMQWLAAPSPKTIVVYDKTMDEDDLSTSAWTLVGALATYFAPSSDSCDTLVPSSPLSRMAVASNAKIDVYWLKGGLDAMVNWDPAAPYLVDGAASPPPPVSSNSSTLPKIVPHLSRSATTFSRSLQPPNNNGTNVQRRASLFTLDTSNVRKASRALSKHPLPPHQPQQQQQQQAMPSAASSSFSSDVAMDTDTATPAHQQQTLSGKSRAFLQPMSAHPATSAFLPVPPPPVPPHQFTPQTQMPRDPSAVPPSTFSSSSSSPSLSSATPTPPAAASDLELEPEPTPLTENEYAFIVSAIVPDFLYLGPEIATIDQMHGLEQRNIRRILNMAEECDDDVPGLKAQFKYTKVAARDTVEMQNVEATLRKAVAVIEEAKKHHEPIYVHCKAGKSRSVAVILAYFVLCERWSLRRAYRHVIKARPWVSPNIGFVAELMKLEESVFGRTSNFVDMDWHKIDTRSPPSPASQRDIGLVRRAWQQQHQLQQQQQRPHPLAAPNLPPPPPLPTHATPNQSLRLPSVTSSHSLNAIASENMTNGMESTAASAPASVTSSTQTPKQRPSSTTGISSSSNYASRQETLPAQPSSAASPNFPQNTTYAQHQRYTTS
ncbi:hypothetical protein BC940DRAFT_289777 [Gongronella butleri]|nr:hypothetical protein BC940DRAFT_289777 [Gongronella butleri]